MHLSSGSHGATENVQMYWIGFKALTFSCYVWCNWMDPILQMQRWEKLNYKKRKTELIKLKHVKYTYSAILYLQLWKVNYLMYICSTVSCHAVNYFNFYFLQIPEVIGNYFLLFLPTHATRGPDLFKMSHSFTFAIESMSIVHRPWEPWGMLPTK